MRKIQPNVVLDARSLERVVAHFQQYDSFAFDVETIDGEYPNTRGVPALNRVTWLSMATTGLTAVIPLGHPIGTKVIGQAKEPRADKNGKVRMFRVPVYEPPPIQMEIGQAFDILRPLFFNTDITKIAHEITFDAGSTAKYWGEVCPGPFEDTKVIMRLLDENTARINNGLKKWIERIFGVIYDTEDVGKCVEKHPFATVAHYSYMDALYDWLLHRWARPLIDAEGLGRVYLVETDLISLLTGMRLAGAHMDVPRLEKLRDELTGELVDIEGSIYKAAGQEFNLNSPQQKAKVLYGPKPEGQALRPWRLTPGGKKWKDQGKEVTLDCYSTDAVALATYPKNPVAKTLLEYQDVNKMLGTYVNAWLGIEGDKKHPAQIYDGYIYPEYQQHGTVSGRFCVAGDTLLETSRGTYRFDEYLPQVDDLVQTHRHTWQQVLRKIYKGQDKMFRVSLYNGSTIKCTAAHRFLTPHGWRSLRNLRPGDKVYSYVSVTDLYQGPGQGSAGVSPVLRQSSEADHPSGSRHDGHHLPQRAWGAEGAVIPGDTEERAEAQVLTFEDERQEPYEGQVWEAEPRLQGRDIGWQWVSPAQGGGRVHPSAQARDGAGAGPGEAAALAGRASHRRGPVQQRHRQSGAGHDLWTWQTTCEEVTIGEIAPVGTMGVWDIEVDGDHSYLANGFVNHNSGRAPNPQNIPRADTDRGKVIRGAFDAPEDCLLCVGDYGQIELVILAHLIGRGKLFDGFLAGIDPHTMTAAGILGKKPGAVSHDERQYYGKTMNFTIVNGGQWRLVAEMVDCSEREAKRILAKHEKEFPEIYAFKEAVFRIARKRRPPHVRSILGRKRRMPELLSNDFGRRSAAERETFNFLIQGGAADIIKVAMPWADRMLAERVPEAFINMTVHDELMVVTPKECAEQAKATLIEAMTGPHVQQLLRVPLTVDCNIGQRWNECH